MTPMPAKVLSLPDNAHQETIDFLRRLSSMLTGGRNAEMLQEAADMIETLSRRAATAEQQDDHARNLELREVAELASDNLIAEMESLKAQLDAEVAALKERLDETRRQAEADRNFFGEQALRLQARVDVTEFELAQANAELDEYRRPAETGIDESIAVVPVASLKLARTQFDYLAKGFASSGDVISQTICEIGASAIDKALDGSNPAADAS